MSTINDSIDIITDKGRIEGLLRIEDARQISDIIEWKLDMLVPKIAKIEHHLETIVDKTRTQGQFRHDELLSVGKNMLSLLR